MKDESRHEYDVWDRLFLLLYPCDETVTDDEVRTDLKRLGIDMKPAFQRLHNMIETRRARARLSAAKETRAAFDQRLRDIAAPAMEDLRAGIRSLIGRVQGDDAQLAYFYKLEGTASEEDLQSLFDDLKKLDAIHELGNESESE